MNIVYFTSIYYPYKGGLQKFLYAMCRYIRQRGNIVTIITGDINIDTIKTETIDENFVVRIPMKKTFGGLPVLKHRSSKAVINTYLKNADVIHNNDIKFLPWFHVINHKKLKAKYFLTSHGFIFHTNNYLFFKKLFMRFFSFFLNRYIHIFCGSHQDYKTAQKYCLKNAVYIGDGIDLSKYAKVSTGNTVKNKLFYYGRIAPNKGLEYALKKFAALPEDFSLTIAGSGEKSYENTIVELCDKLSIAHRVIFLGSVSDEELFKHLESVEIVLLPSLYEGFGLTLVESLAAHKKVIAHPNESYTDILTDMGLTEYLFDFTNSNSVLIDKITQLRGSAARKVDLSKYSFDAVAETVFRYYKK